MRVKTFGFKWWMYLTAIIVLIAVVGVLLFSTSPAEAVSGNLKVGSTSYETWESALQAAGSTGTIVVTGNYTFPDTTESYEVPSGVTLLVPYSASSTSINNASHKHPYANETLTTSATNIGNANSNVSMTLTIPSNVTLNVKGKLIVGGTIYSDANTLWSGATSGAHANVQVDGTLDLNSSSILAVTGYITGNGTVKTSGSGAKIYQPFAVEFRGGGHTAGMGQELTPASGEGKAKVSPFFQWSMQNIRANVELGYGNYVYGYVDMYASSKHNLANGCLLGYGGTGFLRLSSGAKLYTSFDADIKPSATRGQNFTGRKTLRIVGNASTGGMKISTDYITLDTSNYNFPVPYNIHIIQESGIFTVAAKVQLLPGSSVEIREGAALNVVGSELFVYTGANDFTGTAAKSSVSITYPNKKEANLIYPSTAELQSIGENGAANLIVDGTMSFASGGKFAGVVQTNGSGVINTANMTVATLKRSWGGSGSYSANCDNYYMAGETVRSLTPMLYSKGSESVTTMAAGKTYHGTGEADSHTIKTITYTFYYNSSRANTSYTEPLNAEVAGSWGDTAVTLHGMSGASDVDQKTVYLMNGADISSLGYYSDASLSTLVRTYSGQTDLYTIYNGNVYNITWSYKDANQQTVTYTTRVAEGALPSYTGPNMPTYTVGSTVYGPTGWDKTIEPASEDTTYIATYDTVQAKVMETDGKVWYIHSIGSYYRNFSHFDDDKDALGIQDGSTVTLLANCTNIRFGIYVNDLTLDLNGHTITSNVAPGPILLQTSNIKFTLMDSGATKGGIQTTGSLSYANYYHAGVTCNNGVSNAEVIINGVTIDASSAPRGFGVYVRDGAKLTLDGATLTGSIGGIYANDAFSVNIMGNTSVEAIVPAYIRLKDVGANASSLNIGGGTFTSTGNGAVYFADAETSADGYCLPLNDVAGSALVIDYSNTTNGITVSDGTFVGFGGADAIGLVYNNAKVAPSRDGPTLFTTGGYYSTELNTRLYDTDIYSCDQDGTNGTLWHVHIPNYTVTWKDHLGNTLKTDVVPKNTMVAYRADPNSNAEFKNLKTYEQNGTIYCFAGWDTLPGAITADTTFTATYGPAKVQVTDPEGNVSYRAVLYREDLPLAAYDKSNTLEDNIPDVFFRRSDYRGYKNADIPDGSTIKMLADHTTGYVRLTGDITLDLNGHNITSTDRYGLYITGGEGVAIRVINTGAHDATHGVIQSTGYQATEIPNSAVVFSSGNAGISMENVTLKATNNLGIGISGYNDIELTLNDVTIDAPSVGVYARCNFDSVTIQGDTSITAATPIYAMTKSLRIDGGTFTSTGVSANAGWYGTGANAKSGTDFSSGSYTEHLPLSALVIDKTRTPMVDVTGGTFIAGGSDAPVSVVEYVAEGGSAVGTAPEDFLSGGEYSSSTLNTDFYDEDVYCLSEVSGSADPTLYKLEQPTVTWMIEGHDPYVQTVAPGNKPVYDGPAEWLQNGSTYVTSWTLTSGTLSDEGTVQGSLTYTANFTSAQAMVIDPDGNVSYYQTLCHIGNVDAYDPATVFTNVAWGGGLNESIPDGSTIKLLTNIYGSIRVTGNVGLDLNGYNIWASNGQYAINAYPNKPYSTSTPSPVELRIYNSASSGGQVTAKATSTSPNGNEGVIVVNDYVTLTLDGLEIISCPNKNSPTVLDSGGIGVQSAQGASITIKDTKITAGAAGVYTFTTRTNTSWKAGWFQSLTIEGDTEITAATPIYCMGLNLDIRDGKFTSTGVGTNHSLAYYNPQGTAKGYLNLGASSIQLPLSALVIDQSTSPAVSITGGTFIGSGTAPVSIVSANNIGTAPSDFITGGWYSETPGNGVLSTDFYNEEVYSCEQDSTHDNLYHLNAEMEAMVIAPDGSVTYYKYLSDPTNFDTTSAEDKGNAVFYSKGWGGWLNPNVEFGSTVKLLKDPLGNSGRVRVAGRKEGTPQTYGDITLDLNGHSISAAQRATLLVAGGGVNSVITLTNTSNEPSSITSTAAANSSYTDSGAILISQGAQIVVNNLTITATNPNNFGIQSSTDVRLTLNDVTITGGAAGVHLGYNGNSTLAISGDTSINAATPVYAKVSSLSIESGTFTANGTGTQAYYIVSGTGSEKDPFVYSDSAPRSALVIDSRTDPSVTISGGTFIGFDDEEPITFVEEGTEPTDFVTGGLYSKILGTAFYDENSYIWGDAPGNLYMLTPNTEATYVTFDLNGHGTSFRMATVNGGTATEPTEPTHPGYTFGGWYKEATCETAWNFATDTVERGTTLYAKWTPVNRSLQLQQADTLASGSTLTLLTGNYVKNNKHMYVAFDVGSLGSGTVRLGHGKTNYGATYIELTATQLNIINYTSGASTASNTHGLNLSGRVELTIDVGYNGRADITLTCGESTKTFTNKAWSGCNGDIYVEADGVSLTNVDAHWYGDDYDSDVWFFGDSWFSYDNARWPKYFYEDGYTDYLMNGYPGMGATQGLTAFQQALNLGFTPEYAVWCMGMNNADSGSINSYWKTATDSFLALCQEHNITPILTTIPSSSARDHSYKNNWIRANAANYVDVERALISDRATNTWYDGFMTSDGAHPANTAAAQQIYIEIIEKLWDVGAITGSGAAGNRLQATAKNASDIWHGNTVYYYNGATNKCYTAASGGSEITRASVITHNWGAANYVWTGDNSSVTASHTCTIAGCGHTETETVSTTSEVTTAATCTEQGTTTYTATFTKAGFTTQTKSVQNIATLGHSYGTPIWTWDGTTSATATFTCTRCGDTQTRTAAGDAITHTDSSATITYTATVTFDGQTYTGTKTANALARNNTTGKYYPTLAEAITGASGTATITMLGNDTSSGTAVYTIPGNVNLTLDLASYTVYGRIVNSGTLTLDLNGGTLNYHTGATAAAAAYNGMAAVINYGTMTVQDTAGNGGVTTDACAASYDYASAIRNGGNGTLTVTGGTFSATQSINSYSVALYNAGSVTGISDGTFTSNGYTIYNASTGTIQSITGGTVTSSHSSAVYNCGTIGTISDGTYTALGNTGSYEAALSNHGGTITEITGGTFTAVAGTGQRAIYVYGGTIETISGGVFTSTASDCIRVHATASIPTSTIGTISGGTFTGTGNIIHLTGGTVTTISGGYFKNSATWMSVESGGSYSFATGKMLSSEARYTSNGESGYYKVVDQWTVSYNANGGSGTMAGTTVEDTLSFNVAANGFTRSGYEFLGWNTKADGNGTSYAVGTSVTPSANMTLYAQWIAVFTVTWQNDDGTVLETDTGVREGAMPSYDGATPTKASTAQYSYTFSGWTPSVESVTANVTYTATYTSSVNGYTVTWKNWDDTVLETDTGVAYGTTPSYDGATPTRPGSGSVSGYVFSGWTPEIGAVTGDTVYTATFNPVYEITFQYRTSMNGVDSDKSGGTVKFTDDGTASGSLHIPTLRYYTLDHWTLNGEGSYSSEEISAAVKSAISTELAKDSPNLSTIIAKAFYVRQTYTLAINYVLGDGEPVYADGGTANLGRSLWINAQETIEQDGTTYRFSYWTIGTPDDATHITDRKTSYFNGDSPDTTVNFYAHYTTDGNGGTTVDAPKVYVRDYFVTSDGDSYVIGMTLQIVAPTDTSNYSINQEGGKYQVGFGYTTVKTQADAHNFGKMFSGNWGEDWKGGTYVMRMPISSAQSLYSYGFLSYTLNGTSYTRYATFNHQDSTSQTDYDTMTSSGRQGG